jgi:hypothetical protein
MSWTEGFGPKFLTLEEFAGPVLLMILKSVLVLVN